MSNVLDNKFVNSHPAVAGFSGKSIAKFFVKAALESNHIDATDVCGYVAGMDPATDYRSDTISNARNEMATDVSYGVFTPGAMQAVIGGGSGIHNKNKGGDVSMGMADPQALGFPLLEQMTNLELYDFVNTFGYANMASLAAGGEIDVSAHCLPYGLSKSKLADYASAGASTMVDKDFMRQITGMVSYRTSNSAATGTLANRYPAKGKASGLTLTENDWLAAMYTGACAQFARSAAPYSSIPDGTGVAPGTFTLNADGTRELRWFGSINRETLRPELEVDHVNNGPYEYLGRGHANDQVNWLDLSSVSLAGIKFKSRHDTDGLGEVSAIDLSSVAALFTTQAGEDLGHWRNDVSVGIVTGYRTSQVSINSVPHNLDGSEITSDSLMGTNGRNNIYFNKGNLSTGLKERNLQYKRLLEMCYTEGTVDNLPSAREVWMTKEKLGSSSVGHGGIISSILSQGLYKADFGRPIVQPDYLYLNSADAFKAAVDGRVGSTNSTNFDITSKHREMTIMKDYGFSSQQVLNTYKSDLSGEISNKGLLAHRDVFGQSGGFVDQISDMGTHVVFGQKQGVDTRDISAASDVTGYVDLVDKFYNYINNDTDHSFSNSGMFNTTYLASRQEAWDHQLNSLQGDDRLTVSRNGYTAKSLDLSALQKQRLQTFMEMHKGIVANGDSLTHASNFEELNANTANALDSHGTYDVSAAFVGFDNGFTCGGLKEGEKKLRVGPAHASIFAIGEAKGWTDLKEIYGSYENNNGLFMLDNQYNLRTRLGQLDMLQKQKVAQVTGTTTWGNSSNRRAELSDAAGALTVSFAKQHTNAHTGNTSTYTSDATIGNNLVPANFFSPHTFQDLFVNPTDLYQSACVVSRYFPIEDVCSTTINIAKTYDERPGEQSLQDDDDARGVVQGDFGYIANGKVFFPAKHSYLRRTKATAATAYHENVPFLRWMWGGLVRPASSSDKDALSKMTKWSPIPPVLYVDTKDIKDYEKPATQVSNRGTDTSIDTTKAEYTNRNRPSAMTHVLTHFFLDPSFAATAKSSYGTGDVTGAPTVAEKSTALTSLLAVDQAGVLAAIRGLKTGSQTTTSRIGAGVLDVYGATTTLGSVTRQIIVQVLTSIVQNGGDPSLFKELASAVEASDVQYLTTGGVSDAVADLIIDAYILELDNWMATRGDETTFGTGTGAYSTNAHLGYWLPYLRLLSAKQIATRAIEEDGLINITASSQIKVLGLLKAATNSKAGSNLSSDSAARITGINAFFDAGVQKAFVDLAWTERGVNSFTNFSGTKYEAQLAGLIDNFN